jgi:hypothetical protein
MLIPAFPFAEEALVLTNRLRSWKRISKKDHATRRHPDQRRSNNHLDTYERVFCLDRQRNPLL